MPKEPETQQQNSSDDEASVHGKRLTFLKHLPLGWVSHADKGALGERQVQQARGCGKCQPQPDLIH